MIRLTRKVFTDLAIWMIGLGLAMGVIFPFFVAVMGVPASFVMTPQFFAACMTAGFIVGAVNIGLARNVVGQRMRLLADRMRLIETNLNEMAKTNDTSRCTPEECSLPVDSEDEIGDSSRAFNRLVEALAASHRTEAAVRSFNEILTSQLDIDALARQALDQVIANTQANAGAILIESEGELLVIATHGIRSPETIAQSDHVHAALRSEKRQVIALPNDVAVEGVLTDFRPREVLVEPILYKHVPLGLVILAAGAPFTDEALTRLGLVHQGLALALNNALVHDRLQRLAALDPLTGTYNRRFGIARLHEEFRRAVRQSTPLGVFMFDIDHFKQVNDTYGHLVGDRILIRMSQIARSVMREGDILLRYGGEEFLAVLPAASRNDVSQICERLRRMVAEATIAEAGHTIQISISVGGTAFPEFNAEGEQDLVKRADQALYSAKESGRNRVVMV